MAVSSIQCQIDPEEWNHPELLIRSDHLLGNGELNSITDLVYVKPESFRVSETTEMAIDIATINRDLLRNHRAYILVGFGRWGSVDPFLGIPVKWEQIAAAKVIIEAALPEFCPDLSQGSHFFHNLIGLGILYFQTPSWGESKIVWDRLHEQESIHETHYIRHIRSVRPFRVKADSRHQRGVIYR